MSKERWIIVSNRLPVSYDEDSRKLKPSSGGLVTAINSIQSPVERLWLGCAPADLSPEVWQTMVKESKQRLNHLAPVFIDKPLYDAYYNGFCNDVLWPLLHYETERITDTPSAWDAYVKMNKKIADELARLVQPNDLVWVHDFHLFLVPRLLREKCPNARIGFFLHVPFPSSEIFRQLPRRTEILKGVLYSDLVGFHDYSYLRHFSSALMRILGVESTLRGARYKNRFVNLGVFPVSIDTRKICDKAATSKVHQWAKAYRMEKCLTYLGVDRLDYMKGVDMKLLAFRRLLENHPEVRGKVQLVQIAVPTRTEVPDYIQLKQKVDQLVGEINGAFGTPVWTPVKYIFNSVSQEQLLGLYRTSQCLLVTSKRDGMNLVVLEYIAAQNPEAPGAVLLSEFAGAMSMIGQTLAINPWDVEETSTKMKQAFDMKPKEKKIRWQEMFDFLKQYTATDWAESFMNQLSPREEEQPSAARRIDIHRDKDIDMVIKRLKSDGKERILLFVDYDGTLVPIYDRPEDALIQPAVLRTLNRLNRHKNIQLVVISGRPSSFLDQQFKDTNFYLAAEHGARLFDPKVGKWRSRVNSRKSVWYSTALQIMQDYTRRVQKSFVEKKSYSIAWHYRQSPSEYAGYMARKMAEELESGLHNLPVAVLSGKKVIEVRAVEANKGFFVSDFINHLDGDHTPVSIGDDMTDEDMFEAVRDEGLSIKVGASLPTQAKYYIDDQTEVLALLEALGNGL